MNKRSPVLLFVLCWSACYGGEPFKPRQGFVNFLVYFPSRYRGICAGVLVSRAAVLTAAVCVTSPAATRDARPINVVAGATYRHARRGIRVQVTKILIPNLSNVTGDRGYLMEQSAAVLLLRRKVPDVLAEIPMRALDIDYKGEETLALQEECFIPGWHFFYKGDKIYPVSKFLLQRNLRVQFLNIVQKKLWCDTLVVKYQQALSNLGYHGLADPSSTICLRDIDKTAQPCHGMYGAPLICRGRGVAMLAAPDAQWTNCTGFSNLMHTYSNRWLSGFMACVSSLFEPDIQMDWETMKTQIYENPIEDEYDYVPHLYDTLLSQSSSTEL